MRISKECPICQIYENAKCIIYKGDNLPLLGIQSGDTLEEMYAALENFITGNTTSSTSTTSTTTTTTTTIPFIPTYFVSNSGDDNNDGLTEQTPWRTIDKVNATTFVPGDGIGFKRGDSWYGTLTIRQSGTSGNPITFGAYGTGTNPIITGFTDVTAWTNLGGNIWESTNAVSTLLTLEMVTINGVNTAKGRYPNFAPMTPEVYLFFQSHSGGYSITSTSLVGGTDWTGGEAVVRTSSYTLHRCLINAHDRVTGTISWIVPTDFAPMDNYGFFIQNHASTLDVQNEWYYNSSTKKIRIYSTTQPTDVKVATIDKLITVNVDYMNIENLTFTGANQYGYFNNYESSGVYSIHNKITNCDFSFCGISGIKNHADYTIVDRCDVDNCNNIGIDFGVNNKYGEIKNCVITNTGTIQGMGIRGDYKGIGAGTHEALLVENNRIINTGFNGMSCSGDSMIIRNNYVDSFCWYLTDGGGIYSPSSFTSVDRNFITDNIVVNAKLTGEASYGTPYTDLLFYMSESHGIYIDVQLYNYEISGNTISNCKNGIVAAGMTDFSITDNVIYDCYKHSIVAFGAYSLGWNTNNEIKRNIFVQKNQERIVWYANYRTGTTLADVGLIAQMDNNIYARPIYDYVPLLSWQLPMWINSDTQDLLMTFEDWQTISGQDVNSNKSPVAITTTDNIFFEYNDTLETINVVLPWDAVDMYGVSQIAGNIVIPPFGSVMYLKYPE